MSVEQLTSETSMDAFDESAIQQEFAAITQELSDTAFEQTVGQIETTAPYTEIPRSSGGQKHSRGGDAASHVYTPDNGGNGDGNGNG